MKRSIWSLLLCAAVGCGSDGHSTDPFGGDGGGPGGAGGGFLAGGSPSGGVAGGSPSGSVAGGSPAGNPGGTGICMSKTVQSGRVPPDILIVLDRSLSMKMDGVNRWDPSVRGLKSITSMLQDRVSFGLMIFPGPDARAGDSRSCDTGTLRVPLASNNAGAIATTLDGTQPGGRTPTAPTLRAARELIATTSAATPDELPAAQYVLLVTDGAPNCSTGGLGGLGAGGGVGGSGEPAAVDSSVAEIDAMTKAGVKTFVLGYDTQNDAVLKAALDRMAQVGGTGEQAHRAIEDEASLVNAFRQITEVALSCEFSLDQPVSDKRFVLVKLDGKQVNVDTDNGWRLGGDNRTITLLGSACDTIKTAGHTLNVSVECDEIGVVY